MEKILAGLAPESVFGFFEELSAIPRGSGNEKAASDYITEFARRRGLEVSRDELWNTIVCKPAAPGCASDRTVILQCHLDMVCDKRPEVDFDFESDGIRLVRDGDWLRANGTTLGADNGIGVAMALAALDDKTLEHPALEAVFTVQEEIGLVGARNLDFSQLGGRFILNLDSDDPSSVVVGCCGGMDFILRRTTTTEDSGEYTQGLLVSLSGLHGGHSGTDITLNRASAIRLLGRVLTLLEKQADFRICSLAGGGKRNAIPRDARALLAFTAASLESGRAALERALAQVKTENRDFEPGFFWEISPAPADKVLSKADMNCLLSLLVLYPDGVNTNSLHFAGMAESSTNAGILETHPDGIVLSGMIRSNSASRHREIATRFERLAAALGLSARFEGEYPAWEYNAESALLDIVRDCYREIAGSEMKVTATHGGLECGVFADALPGSQAVSMGVLVRDLHSPDEAMYLPSVGQGYRLLCAVLKMLAAGS